MLRNPDNRLIEKSSVLNRTLLLAFFTVSFQALASVPDTIIIGGKYLVIEREELSDREFAHHYGQDNRNRRRCFLCGTDLRAEFALVFQGNLAITSAATNAAGFETLGNFIQRDRAYCPGRQTGLELGWRFSRKFTLMSGISQVVTNHCFRSFDPLGLADDSLPAFLNPERGVLDQVFLAVDDPLGQEFDTLSVGLEDARLSVTGWFIPLGFRWNTLPSKGSGSFWHYRADLWLMLQQVDKTPVEKRNPMLVAANGSWLEVATADLGLNRMLSGARFSGGRTWQLWKHPQQDQFIQLSAGLAITLPAGPLNDATTYSVALWKTGAYLTAAYVIGRPDR